MKSFDYILPCLHDCFFYNIEMAKSQIVKTKKSVQVSLFETDTTTIEVSRRGIWDNVNVFYTNLMLLQCAYLNSFNNESPSSSFIIL